MSFGADNAEAHCEAFNYYIVHRNAQQITVDVAEGRQDTIVIQVDVCLCYVQELFVQLLTFVDKSKTNPSYSSPTPVDEVFHFTATFDEDIFFQLIKNAIGLF